ncbi:MAG: reverse transcriptase/maturase family protein [bacterium]
MFEFNLEDNLLELRQQLREKVYRHGSYQSFYVCDPKLRHIHKATVRDRVVHQAVFRVLYHVFDPSFIHDSYSCRVGKGTHAGVRRLAGFARRASKNNARTAYALKCDIRKFFDSIDHDVLSEMIKSKIKDEDTLWLVETIVNSFEKIEGKGLPLGNVTSQLFSNIYLNELDQFVKHALKAKYYLRYCDDFIIMGDNKEYLENAIDKLRSFLVNSLRLCLHEGKIEIRKHRQGIDFLGYVVFHYHAVLRTKTERRMLRIIRQKKMTQPQGEASNSTFYAMLNSYAGMLKHCHGHTIWQGIVNLVIP